MAHFASERGNAEILPRGNFPFTVYCPFRVASGKPVFLNLH